MSVIKRVLSSWPGRAAVIGVAAIVTIVATVSIGLSPRTPGTAPGPTQGDRSCASGRFTPGAFTVLSAPCPLTGGPVAATFADGAGRTVSLADFSGRVVLVNLWATWCPPCIKEMPDLNALQAKLGGADFKVIAISQDTGGATLPRTFLVKEGLDALDLYVDGQGITTRALQAPGLPTSVLFDRQGREIARLIGPADWASDTMIDKIRTLGGF